MKKLKKFIAGLLLSAFLFSPVNAATISPDTKSLWATIAGSTKIYLANGFDRICTNSGGLTCKTIADIISGGGAPADATYITQTANGTLSAEQALSALATGILKNTTTTGVLSVFTTALTEAANTFNFTNGTASLDIAAGAALNIDTGLQTTTNAGTLAFTGAGKTLNVEDTSTVNQDLTTDATTTFAGVNATTFDTNVAAAGVTLAGTTLAADGTDAAINLNLTPKGTGDVAIGAYDVTMTGSLGATGARVTKGWFTDLESTNAIAGSITGNAATVTTNANLTGPVTSTGNATAIASGAIKSNMLQSAAADLGAADVTIDLGNTNGAFVTNLTTDGTITATAGFTGNVSGTAATVTGATQASITSAANLVTVGALTSGSIASGFGTIATANSITGTTLTATAAGGLTLGTDVAGGTPNIAGYIKMFGSGDDAFYNTFTSGDNTANATYTLPVAMPAVSGYQLTSTDAGVMSWAAAGGLTWGDSISAGAGTGITLASTTLAGHAHISSAHTASGTLTANTTNTNTFSASRDYTLNSGSVTDNFAVAAFSRTNINTTAGGTLLAQGSVVSISGTDTQTAGTLTPSYDLLKLTPSLRSTGSAINLSIPDSIATAPTNGFFSIVTGNTQSTNSLIAAKINVGTSTIVNNRGLIITGGGATGMSGYSTLLVLDNADGGAGTTFANTAISITNRSSNNTNVGVAGNVPSGTGLSILQLGAAGSAIVVTGNDNVNSATNGLVNYTLTNTQSGATVVQKINTGTSAQAQVAYLAQVYNASTTAKAFNAQLSTTGTGIAYNADSSALSGAGQLLRLTHTASGTLTANTTAQAQIASSRTYTLTSGTVADNYNVANITRTSITTGAGGTLTAAGAVLSISNVATQTAGTLTDTVIPLIVSQDADSTGNIASFQIATTEKAAITPAGTFSNVTGSHILLGGSTAEAGSTNTLAILNGTAPDAHVDNEVIIFSSDSGDATATLSLFLEQAVEEIGTFTESHKFKININGVFYWISLDAV